jgi:hypothetical protein
MHRIVYNAARCVCLGRCSARFGVGSAASEYPYKDTDSVWVPGLDYWLSFSLVRKVPRSSTYPKRIRSIVLQTLNSRSSVG